MSDNSWIPQVLNDRQVKFTVILSATIIALVFIASYISAEIRASNGERIKWLWGAIEYNIPDCDNLAEPNFQHEDNNTQINQPNGPIRIGGHDTYNK